MNSDKNMIQIIAKYNKEQYNRLKMKVEKAQ